MSILSVRFMHFVAMLIAGQVLISATSAEMLHESAVVLFKEACVAPVTPEAMMIAGEKLAEARRWKLVKSGRAPIPFMHNENGPHVSVIGAWELDLPEASGVTLVISIIGPEISGVRHSVCLIEIPVTEFIDEKLERQVEQLFGTSIVKDPRFKASQGWLFTQEKSAGNCGKQISISHQNYRLSGAGKSNTLIFLDMAYPNDGQWIGALAGTTCRS